MSFSDLEIVGRNVLKVLQVGESGKRKRSSASGRFYI